MGGGAKVHDLSVDGHESSDRLSLSAWALMIECQSVFKSETISSAASSSADRMASFTASLLVQAPASCLREAVPVATPYT